MTRPPEKTAIPLSDLSACCPDAQADGVPCPALGRDCEVCEQAIKTRDRAAREEEVVERDDSWAV